LLAGLAVIWLLSGSLLFITVREVLTAKLDTELELLLREVELLLTHPDAPETDRPSAGRALDLFVVDGGAYFQTWDDFGLFSDRSPSLAQHQLPKPDRFTYDPQHWNDTTTSGERIRVRAQLLPLRDPDAAPDESPWGVRVVVAVNRDSLDLALSRVVMGACAVGMVAILSCVVVVWSSLTAGLGALQQFGEQCREIHADSLGSRFSEQDLPDELKPVSRSLNDLMERLARSFERERRFSADVAHELRTPVAELKTLAECSLRWPEGEDRTETSRDVLAIADQMQGILRDLLTINRLEQGQTKLATEETDVAGLVRECWHGLSEAARARRLQVEFSGAPTCIAETDPGLLRIIATNLLSNAVAYCPRGGRITACVESRGRDRFELVVRNDVDGVVTPADIAHFFDRFWQGEASRSSPVHHGLGLSLCRLCADVLGCRLGACLVEHAHAVELRLSSV
jgi:two-component system sensor histidine kinase QseC